jgi:hypothetical protein
VVGSSRPAAHVRSMASAKNLGLLGIMLTLGTDGQYCWGNGQAGEMRRLREFFRLVVPYLHRPTRAARFTLTPL